jgi:hypothetical protein
VWRPLRAVCEWQALYLTSVFMALDRDIVRKMKALRSFLFVGLSRGVDVLVRWSMGARPTSEKSDDDNV